MNRINSLDEIIKNYPRNVWSQNVLEILRCQDTREKINLVKKNWNVMEIFPIDVLMEHIDLVAGIYDVAKSEKIPWDFIKKNLHLSWNKDGLAENPNITWEIILENTWLLDYETILVNPNITWEIIQQNPTFEWDVRNFASNANMSMKIYKENPNLSWHTSGLSRNVTMQMVLDNPKLDWDYYALTCENPNITIKDILDNPTFPWARCKIYKNPTANWQDLLAATSSQVERSCSASCAYITPDILMQHEWCNCCATRNPNLNWWIVTNCKNIKFYFDEFIYTKFSCPKWDFGKGWYFVPNELKHEVFALYWICIENNINELFHYIIEILFR